MLSILTMLRKQNPPKSLTTILSNVLPPSQIFFILGMEATFIFSFYIFH